MSTQVLFTGKTHTTPSHVEGAPRGDERIDIRLSTPRIAGNDINFSGIQNHPAAEQLFAGAWSACYSGALGLTAQMKKLILPSDRSVDIEVDLVMKGSAYVLQARIDVHLPGIKQDVADAIAKAAHEVCPYSKAVHGNIEVVTTVTVG